MEREVKFSLVFRDMWQSAGKYVPRVDQLVKVAPAIIEMGCFARVETNGGGFEQVNLLFGENPNNAVRQWTKPFHEAGIQTHMLDRALNGLRMSPVPADVRKLFYKVKKVQGTDITRTFCGLNDVRNIIPSIGYAHDAGMISQCCLCITYSPIHTVEYYLDMAKKLIEAGCDEICIKDMAGIGRPVFLGKIVAGIKKIKNIPVQYHSHAAPGFNMASILEVCKAGCDYVDVGMDPLSWGTGHADVIAVQAMLKDAGFKVPEINMTAYMKVRSLIQEFMDDFLGLYISPRNRMMNSLLVGPGLPGGMMGSLMADLETNLDSINKYKAKHNLPLMTQDELLIKLFDEVSYVWPRVGYPCLVTPFSQYVKNLAMMNVIQMEKGKERWSMIADDIWDMILGKAGKLPGELAPEIIEKAKAEGRTFFNDNPQDNYPDQLDKYRQMMKEKGWEFGQDDEELFEYAMHPAQYEAYRSGKAKADFLADVEKRRAEKNAGGANPKEPQVLTVDVNGQPYRVTVAFGEVDPSKLAGNQTAAPAAASAGEGKEVLSPLEGKFFLTKGAQDTPVKVGDKVNKGDVICYVEAMKTYNAIRAEFSGIVTAICVNSGDAVSEDDVLMKIA
ncbi:biotin/lipoyl-containing protein [Bacteroides ilei]|uniref:biotin/lipoyl-containing protein n=1 Tax=Bacteroides ilei TaxID=1907658 RepID=UPI003AB5FA61